MGLKTKFFIALLSCCIAVHFSVFAQHKKYEMRGVWIATVANIDWPSKPALNSEWQRYEMKQMLAKLAENNINCIILQVRPAADAFYPSPLEPWSQWLTGKQGAKPDPYYDPLKFVIDEAHQLCMEVHLWLNPYRVTNGEDATLSRDHLYYKSDSMFVKYGPRILFNPGLDATRHFLNRVVEDIVERYDMDAIHLDDYFYPYPEAGQKFPDDNTFYKYPRGFTNRGDWRRNNVNLIISELQQTIKAIKPWVEFGVSPFGVWRNSSRDPRGSKTATGVTNYDDLYADILKWLKDGTIDYVAPQLYWEIGKKIADYQTLLQWWTDNSYGKNLYVGLFASGLKVNAAVAWKRPNEIARQMAVNQNFPKLDGALFFSAKPFIQNLQGLNDTLKTNYYRYPALNPVNRNITGEQPNQVTKLDLLRDEKYTLLMWDKVDGGGGGRIAYYVVYAFKGRQVGDLNNPACILAKTADNLLNLNLLKEKLNGRYTFVVTAVNRYRIESKPSFPLTERLQ